MRKALIVMLALLLALTGVGAYAFREVNAPREAVEYTVTSVYGDAAAADGLTVRLGETLRGHLLWNGTVRLEESGGAYETDYLFAPREIYEKDVPSLRGVSVTEDYFMGAWSPPDGAEPTGIDRAKAELFEETEPGTSRRRRVRLADYYEYYPLIVNIELPTLFYGYYPGQGDGAGPEAYAVRRITEFFSIPVLEDHYVDIEISKSADGRWVDTSGVSTSQTGDSFSLYTSGVVGEKACYFWFGNRTSQGALVDTSRIPGGYGIYALPYGHVRAEHYRGVELYDGPDVFADELAVFYPVDEQSRIIHLGMSGDRERLTLHTVEDGVYTVTVLSAQTAEVLQRLELAEYDPDGEWADIVDGEGFVFIRIGTKRLLVLSENDAGGYEKRIDAPLTDIERGEDYLPWNCWNTRDMVFDGEKLAVVGAGDAPYGRYAYRESGCGFFAAVYTGEGLRYYGLCGSSLDEANTAAYGNIYDNSIRPRVKTPVKASWDG